MVFIRRFLQITKCLLLVGEDRIVVSLKDDFVPSSAEDNVRHQDLVLESSSERALASLLAHLLYLSPDPRNRSDLGSDVVRHFHRRVEHAFDEGGVLHDFQGFADEFDFLHDFEGLVDFGHDGGACDSELFEVVPDRLREDHARVLLHEVAVEDGVAELMLGRVLQVTHAVVLVLGRKDDHRLVPSPPA